jgi:hypothetical protein
MEFLTLPDCKLPQNWRTTPTISEKIRATTVNYSKIGELLPQLAKNRGNTKIFTENLLQKRIPVLCHHSLHLGSSVASIICFAYKNVFRTVLSLPAMVVYVRLASIAVGDHWSF